MRVSGLLGRGLLAVVVAMAATVSVAAVARAVGVDVEVPNGGAESIPVSGERRDEQRGPGPTAAPPPALATVHRRGQHEGRHAA